MKTPLLLHASLVCALASNLYHAASAAPPAPVASKGAPIAANKMPSEVRALMPAGARTTGLALFPIGAKGAPVLLHAWTIKRGSATNDAPPLFCIDLFYRDQPNAGKWQLASSISYVHEEWGFPPSYETHWLHPATKQGIVISEYTGQPTGGTFRLITLPDGVPTQSPSDRDVCSVQKFFTSTSGGFASIDFSKDAGGELTIEENLSSPTAAPGTLNTFAWRNGRWIKVASRKFKRQ